jgi:hypothetical protein
MIRRTVLLAAVLAAPVVAAPASAQSEHGAFITRLGDDTLAVERFTRTGNRLEGDRVARAPRTALLHYVATLGPDGRVTRIEGEGRAGNALDAPATQSTVMEFGKDTVVATLRAGDSTRTMRIAAADAVPIFNMTYALYDQAIRHALKSKGDSIPMQFVFAGAPQPVESWVLRGKDRDSVTIGIFGFPGRARVDSRGRMLGFDGSQTTVKVLVTRLPDADVMAFARAFAAKEAASRPLGQLSPRDTARADLGGAHLLVDYGRPSKRGRPVFGGIVPWGQVWRTGANAATQFETDRDLVVGGTPVKAGKYTLWTLPTADGTQLIVNGQTGQWGTEYDASKDVVRIPVKTSSLASPVEVFTIAIDPAGAPAGGGSGAGGTLRMQWDTTEWSVPVEVK